MMHAHLLLDQCNLAAEYSLVNSPVLSMQVKSLALAYIPDRKRLLVPSPGPHVSPPAVVIGKPPPPPMHLAPAACFQMKTCSNV